MTTRRYYVRITLRSEERDEHGCIVDGALDAETTTPTESLITAQGAYLRACEAANPAQPADFA